MINHRSQFDPVPNLVGAMTAAEFEAIADFAKKSFGLHLPPAKQEMVFARLIKRLRRVRATSFENYLEIVKHPSGSAERSEFLSALTTNVTHFFREPHHFDYLRQMALPPLIAAARRGKRLRLWSAGCSAGQEAYSLAATVLELCPDAASLDIKVLATDIDPKILERAQQNTYPVEELPSIPADLRPMVTALRGDSSFSITKPVCDLIRFGELNLIHDWPMVGLFDIIFCRNVAIYFDGATQSKLWERFTEKLTDDGHLFIGHSERLSGPAMQIMQSKGVTIYQKNPIYSAQARS